MNDATKQLLEALERRGPYQKLEDVRRALAAGADPNAVSKGRASALALACTPAHAAEGVVELLLDAGAEVNSVDDSGRTPLHRAAFGNRELELDSVRRLLAKGATVQTVDRGGDSPLHGSTFNDCTEMAALLLEAGAQLTLTNRNGETPADAAKEARAKGVLALFRKRSRQTR